MGVKITLVVTIVKVPAVFVVTTVDVETGGWVRVEVAARTPYVFVKVMALDVLETTAVRSLLGEGVVDFGLVRVTAPPGA